MTFPSDDRFPSSGGSIDVLDDPFVRKDKVSQFRYLRAKFEDNTLRPGEIPDLIAESGCTYDDKDFSRFKPGHAKVNLLSAYSVY